MTSQRCLLCVDDEGHILRSLERTLRKEPYCLLTTTDTTQVLELIRQNSVQVVISDYRMESMTGLELLRIGDGVFTP